MIFEYCFKCDEPTGKAGIDNNSLYDENDCGPYCEECWDKKVEGTYCIKGDICIVTVNSNLDRNGAGDFKTDMNPLIENKTIKGIAINFSKVDVIDSFGIGKVLLMFKSLQKQGAKLAIYNMSHKINEIFKMTQLDKVLNLQRTEEEALSSLKGSYGN